MGKSTAPHTTVPILRDFCAALVTVPRFPDTFSASGGRAQLNSYDRAGPMIGRPPEPSRSVRRAKTGSRATIAKPTGAAHRERPGTAAPPSRHRTMANPASAYYQDTPARRPSIRPSIARTLAPNTRQQPGRSPQQWTLPSPTIVLWYHANSQPLSYFQKRPFLVNLDLSDPFVSPSFAAKEARFWYLGGDRTATLFSSLPHSSPIAKERCGAGLWPSASSSGSTFWCQARGRTSALQAGGRRHNRRPRLAAVEVRADRASKHTAGRSHCWRHRDSGGTRRPQAH